MSVELVYVYKSLKKSRAYLYLRDKDAFTVLPDPLLDAFGAPKFLMVFSISKRQSLPKVDIGTLKDALNDKGYFLRIDTEQEEENLLNIERKRLGLPPLEHDEIKDFFH